MFPDVRLLLATLFVSVVALSCGFAVFAAFRVNHDPLNRMSGVTAPLQIAMQSPAPLAANPPGAMAVSPPVTQQPVETPAAVTSNGDAATAPMPMEPMPDAGVLVTPDAETRDLAPQPDQNAPALATEQPAPATAQEPPAAAVDATASAPPQSAPVPAPAADITAATPDQGSIVASAPEGPTTAPTGTPASTRTQDPAIAQKLTDDPNPASDEPASPVADAKPDTAAARSDDPPTASIPTIGAADSAQTRSPSAGQAAPAGRTPDVTNRVTAQPVAPGPKPRVALVHRTPVRSVHSPAHLPGKRRVAVRSAAKTPAAAKVAAKPLAKPAVRRIARRRAAPATAQNGSFDNPVFQSAPDVQRGQPKSTSRAPRVPARTATGSEAGTFTGGATGQ